MKEMYKETAAGWAERCRISTQYLRQAAEAAEPDRQAILCKLVEKLFDFQIQPRVDLVRSEYDLLAFDAELRITWSFIIFPLLPTTLNEAQMEGLRIANAARQAHWMSLAIEKVHPPAPPGMITRKEAIDRYLREVFERTGKKITRGDFWRSAGYKNSTEFERWQRKDPKTNKTADANFRRILKEKPHLKLDPHRAVVKPLVKA